MFSTQLLTLNYLLYSPTNAAPEFLQKFIPIYNWLRGWPEFSGPITARGNAEPMQSLITFWASIKGALSGRFPTYCDSRSATFQIHTADQLPTILFTEVFLGSVQKPFSIITSDYMQSLITFWASIKGALSGRFPTYCDSRSATFQIHTADQLPTILFTEVFLGSVQKPFSIITSDYIKFPVQNSLTKCTSPVY